jgi:hypothetical protein
VSCTRIAACHIVDYIVLTGSNAKKLDELSEGVERGHNRNAFPKRNPPEQIGLHTPAVKIADPAADNELLTRLFRESQQPLADVWKAEG